MILTSSVFLAPAGLFLPFCWPESRRQEDRWARPSVNIFCGASLVSVTGATACVAEEIISDRYGSNWQLLVNSLMCSICAVIGIAINISLAGFLFCTIWVQEVNDCRRFF